MNYIKNIKKFLELNNKQFTKIQLKKLINQFPTTDLFLSKALHLFPQYINKVNIVNAIKDNVHLHKCPVCNKLLNYYQCRRKLICCSMSCAAKYDKTQNKRKQTLKKKYGVEHQLQIAEVKNKIKQTSLERYGVDNPAKSSTVIDKMKTTNLEKYGVSWIQQKESFKEKSKRTCLERYRCYQFQQNRCC